MSREDSFEAGKSRALSPEAGIGGGGVGKNPKFSPILESGLTLEADWAKGRDPTEAAMFQCQCCLSPSPRGGCIFLNKQKN